MNYVVPLDEGLFQATADRVSQVLYGPDAGAVSCNITYIQTPAGGGSPAGLHTHAVDQIFYVLDGTMTIEVAGSQHTAGPGTLIVFPAGVPHRNWNADDKPTRHLAIAAPPPDPQVEFAIPVQS
jgi:quercetin dioxygenase-like cupin family protein